LSNSPIGAQLSVQKTDANPFDKLRAGPGAHT
jgi:hypothetical protein